jgi:helix-turn-helix protein
MGFSMASRPLLSESWFTEESLAQRLEVTVKTLRSWRHSGKGPKYLKVSRAVHYPESTVNDWLASQIRTAKVANPPPKKPPARLNKRNVTRAEKRYLLTAKAASSNLQ